MNKKLFLSALLLVGSVVAMQQQQEQKQKEQEQEQQKPKKKPKKDQDQTPEEPKADDEIADLQDMLATIMNGINLAHGSVTDMVAKIKRSEHRRICPTCGRPATECDVDKGRLQVGNVMLCGCPICGGLKI